MTNIERTAEEPFCDTPAADALHRALENVDLENLVVDELHAAGYRIAAEGLLVTDEQARTKEGTILDVMADRLRIVDAMKAANNSSAPMVALICALRDAGIDPEMQAIDLARLIALGEAFERRYQANITRRNVTLEMWHIYQWADAVRAEAERSRG